MIGFDSLHCGTYVGADENLHCLSPASNDPYSKSDESHTLQEKEPLASNETQASGDDDEPSSTELV